MEIAQKINQLDQLESDSSLKIKLDALREKNKSVSKLEINSIGWDSHHDHSNFGDLNRMPQTKEIALKFNDNQGLNFTDHTDFSDSGVS